MPGTERAALAAGVLAAVAAAGPFGYPVWLWWRSRSRSDPQPLELGVWPPVTVVVAAYLERAVIAAKVEDLRANGYDGELEIVVVADDAATAAAARDAGARVIEPASRRGKASAVNLGMAAAHHPIVVLTDANAMLAPGSIAALAQWFVDPSVGAVAGEKQVLDSTGGEGMYWRMESWLKRREHRLGGTIGLVGELAAVRVDRIRPLPEDIIVDDLWIALDVLEAGGRVAYEPSAVAFEDATPSMTDEWERRTRNIAGMLDVIARRRGLLHPKHGALAAQLWGHRFVRATVGPLAHASLLGLAIASLGRSWVARCFILGHVAAVGGLARSRAGSATRIERLAGQVMWLQAVGVGGTVRYLRHDHPAAWPKAERAGLTAPEDRG